MDKLKIEYMNIDDLIPYINNPRVNDHAVAKVASSIKNFGFKVPVLIDNKNEIIAGHVRIKAAKRLGMKEVPTIRVEDLSPMQVRAFRVADNKTAEIADWDFELLELELEGLDDEFTGFDLGEIEGLFAEPEKDDEEKPEVEFTKEVLEESQYVVLYFDNIMDWQVAQEVFEIKTVAALDSREGYERKGVGRVLKGEKVLEWARRGKESADI